MNIYPQKMMHPKFERIFMKNSRVAFGLTLLALIVVIVVVSGLPASFVVGSAGTSPSSPDPELTSAILPENAGQVSQTGKLNLTTNARQIAWSSDKKWLAVAAYGIDMYDAQTMKLVYTIDSLQWVNSVAFSPDSAFLVGSDYRGFYVWRVDGWAQVFSGSDVGDVGSVAISPDGVTLATAVGNAVKLWNMGDWTELRTLPVESVKMVTFSPDGKTLAASGDGVFLWEYSSGQQLGNLTGHKGLVNSVAFSADGEILASGSDDKKIWLWSMTNNQQLRVLTGHSGYIESVAFSPGGQLLASGSWDLTVKLWDVITGQELRSLTGHTGWIQTVAFSPSGERLASGANSDPVLLWGLAYSSSSPLVPVESSDSPAVNTPTSSVKASSLPTSSATTLPTSSLEPSSNSLLWYYVIAAIVGLIGVSIALLTFYFVHVVGGKKVLISKERVAHYTRKIEEIEKKVESKSETQSDCLKELDVVKKELYKDDEIKSNDRRRVEKFLVLITKRIKSKE
jgi:WD40 repeat protein